MNIPCIRRITVHWCTNIFIGYFPNPAIARRNTFWYRRFISIQAPESILFLYRISLFACTEAHTYNYVLMFKYIQEKKKWNFWNRSKRNWLGERSTFRAYFGLFGWSISVAMLSIRTARIGIVNTHTQKFFKIFNSKYMNFIMTEMHWNMKKAMKQENMIHG